MADRYVIGVDVGGTKLLAGVIDDQLRVHQRVQKTTGRVSTAALLGLMADAVSELIAAAAGDVQAVGFGIPSMMDQRRGVSVMSVSLPLVEVAVASVMSERLGLPVFVDNDGNVAALAESRGGAARGVRDAVMLTIGTGIGGGLILAGELYRGSVGAAAELGHIVIDADGPPCQGSCHSNGCLEVMASGTALGIEAQRLAAEQPESGLARAASEGREIDGALVTELAHDGDQVAIEALTLIGTRLGIGVAGYVNVFNPALVVIGGGVIAAGDMLLDPVRAEVERRCLRPNRDVVRVVAAHFGTEAGMVGAGALAFEGLANPDLLRYGP